MTLTSKEKYEAILKWMEEHKSETEIERVLTKEFEMVKDNFIAANSFRSDEQLYQNMLGYILKRCETILLDKGKISNLPSGKVSKKYVSTLSKYCTNIILYTNTDRLEITYILQSAAGLVKDSIDKLHDGDLNIDKLAIARNTILEVIKNFN